MLLPMRYSAGLMLGDDPFGIWGPMSKHAFGHLGLANKFCWADPAREISVAILNSGLAVIGPHIAPLVNLIRAIGNNVPAKSMPRTFAYRFGQKRKK